MFELTADQIVLVGLIATVLTAVIRYVFAKVLHTEIHKGWATGVVALVSLGLAVIWNPLSFPLTGDPVEVANALLQYLTAVIGAATVIYNLLLKRVIDALFPDAFDVIK